MSYAIRELFNTLQGEGARAGSRSVFVRFAGCNLWDGRPEHRHRGKGACAQWCDTDFAKGKKLNSKELLAWMDAAWAPPDCVPTDLVDRWCVLTGGEPMLQLDHDLMDELKRANWRIAVETNGSIVSSVLHRADWICVSPKLGAELVVSAGSELKVVLPGDSVGVGWTDEQLLHMESSGKFANLFVQPMDPIDPRFVGVSHLHRNVDLDAVDMPTGYNRALTRCMEFIMRHPRWRLSLQTHKITDMP